MNNEQNLLELKNKFISLENTRDNINKLFALINEMIDNLTQLYKELTKPNNTELYIICLDTFHFQKVLLNMEYKELESYYTTISNRIYCDYYKLSTLIIHYIRDNFKHQKDSDKTEVNIVKKINIFDKYPKYDDLDIHKEYSFTDISNIYNDIISILLALNNNIVYKQQNLENYKKKSQSGLKIDNFVYSYESNLNEIDNKLKLFCNYTLFFVDAHNNYFDKFLNKIKLIYDQISEDIKLEENMIHSNENIEISQQGQNLEQTLNDTLDKTKNILNNTISPKRSSLMNNLENLSPNRSSLMNISPILKLIPSDEVNDTILTLSHTESQDVTCNDNENKNETLPEVHNISLELDKTAINEVNDNSVNTTCLEDTTDTDTTFIESDDTESESFLNGIEEC